MLLPRLLHLSTLTRGLLRHFVTSAPSAVSLECSRCGFAINAHGEAGISSWSYVITFNPPSLSPCRLVLVPTLDGSALISCGCSQSDATLQQTDSGSTGGNYSTGKSSDHDQK